MTSPALVAVFTYRSWYISSRECLILNFYVTVPLTVKSTLPAPFESPGTLFK